MPEFPKIMLLGAGSLALAACSMNPRLDMPKAPVASAYPEAERETASDAALDWRKMFLDPRLQRLIALALDENRDLRIAVLNAQAARAQLQIQRGGALPQVGLQGSYARQLQPSGVAGASIGSTTSTATGYEYGQVTAQAALSSFEIDLFGRLRSLNQAAAETYLASEEGRRAARITVIGTVADAYVSERLADEQLRLAQATLRDWQASLELTRRLKIAGQSSGLDLTEAEGQVQQASMTIIQRRREMAQATNALVLAVGAPMPDDLPAPTGLMEQPVRTHVAAGLPSDLLLRRPDILRAEHELLAANANIGAARASFFPRISLTAAYGFSSLALDSLFQGASQSWSFSPSVAVPIFQGGQLRGNLALARARKSIALATYEKAIQTAFREVADGLAGRATYARQREEQSIALSLARRRVVLAEERFGAGVSSRLELLEAQRNAYTVEQSLLTIRRDEIASAITLYRSIGGGL